MNHLFLEIERFDKIIKVMDFFTATNQILGSQFAGTFNLQNCKFAMVGKLDLQFGKEFREH